jgi:uncharacterized protein with PIN domain
LFEVETRFIIDNNVGRLAKWLRMMGYDAILFNEVDDGRMVKYALSQDRIIITRDSEFMKRRAVTTGRVKAILVAGDDPEAQMQKVMRALQLDSEYKPFSRCIECNTELLPRDRQQVAESVPPRVYDIQEQYMECPSCRRLFWRGTHWQAMNRKLHRFGSVKS